MRNGGKFGFGSSCQRKSLVISKEHKPDSVTRLPWRYSFICQLKPAPPKEDAAYPEPLGGSPGPLFCLAPDWVYHASLVTSGAVGSYSTFSPLPCRSKAV